MLPGRLSNHLDRLLMTSRLLPALTGFVLLAAAGEAVNVRITIDNIAPSTPTGLYFTRVWTGFHDGSFELFEVGTAASAELRTVAEVGNVVPLDTLFHGSVSNGVSAVTINPTGPGGSVFNPGSTISFDLNLDPGANRYLSFASMLIPSNDTFFGANSLEIFDGTGTLIGGSWTFGGTGSYDAGTEENDLSFGAAFIPGNTSSQGTPTVGGIVALQSASALDELLGVMTNAGTTIGTTSGDIFRISVTAVPEPSALGFLVGLGALVTTLRRRR
jgi:hypothetical protein